MMMSDGHKGGSMRTLPSGRLAVAILMAAMAVGCSRFAQLQAARAVKAANQAYQRQDYKEAAELYEQAIQANPDLAPILFYIGNSYDQQYKPSRRGEPENDALLDKAVKYYQEAADKLALSESPDDKKLAKLSLEYLVSVYGVDKMNDPARAEPVVQKMIQLEPGEPTNYFALAKIYEDAGVYDEAEQMLLWAKQAKPSDPAVYMQLAGYYNRQNEFEKTIEALQDRAKVEPNNPEAHFTISTYYWDNAQRNFRLTDQEKRAQVSSGIEAVDKALALNGDYMEALVYKGLLLRLQANLEKDPGRQQALLKEAIALKDKAEDLRKKRSAGA
jgi:tetratricopeptide (TPR) repeat protein